MKELRIVGDYTIRLARSDDAPLLPEVEREAASLFASVADDLGIKTDRPPEVNSIDTFLKAQEVGRLWVAADSDHGPVGFALVTEIDGFAHLEELDVVPTHGRQGLGSALLEAVCSWAKESAYPAVTLSTFRDIPWNGPFYLRRGFRIVDPLELSVGLLRIVKRSLQKVCKRHQAAAFDFVTTLMPSANC